MRPAAVTWWILLIAGSAGVFGLGTVVVLTALWTDVLGTNQFGNKADLAQTGSSMVSVAPEAKETVIVKGPVKKPVSVVPVDPTNTTKIGPPKAADVHQLHGLNDVPSLSPEAPAASAETKISDPTSSKPAANNPRSRAFDPNAKGREVLPWDLIEPVPLSPTKIDATTEDMAAATRQPTAVATPAPMDNRAVEDWLKVTSREIKAENQARPLTHLELWLAPPAEVARHLVSVAYAFSTPAIQPQSQTSTNARSGFRIKVGALACADTLTLTLTFDDGRTNKVAIDGCRLFGSKAEQGEGKP
jgi:hypothetical protein